MKTLLVPAFLLANLATAAMADGTPADHDFYKTVCVWDATGSAVNGQLQFDTFDPYTFQLQAGGWASYSWIQQKGTVDTPALKFWYPATPGGSLDTTSAPQVLAPLDTEQERDCAKLRRLAIHYRIEEVYGSDGSVTGFSLRGPISNP